MKHTPGPWKVKSDYNVFSGGGRLVANSGGHSGSVRPEEINEENKANAILIAAAPELLKQLKQIYSDALQGALPNWGNEWYERTRDVIARAESQMIPCEFCGDTTDTHQPWGLVECVDLDACLCRQAAQGDEYAAQLAEERRARKERKAKI